jgi:hypothetical protein
VQHAPGAAQIPGLSGSQRAFDELKEKLSISVAKKQENPRRLMGLKGLLCGSNEIYFFNIINGMSP